MRSGQGILAEGFAIRGIANPSPKARGGKGPSGATLPIFLDFSTRAGSAGGSVTVSVPPPRWPPCHAHPRHPALVRLVRVGRLPFPEDYPRRARRLARPALLD